MDRSKGTNEVPSQIVLIFDAAFFMNIFLFISFQVRRFLIIGYRFTVRTKDLMGFYLTRCFGKKGYKED